MNPDVDPYIKPCKRHGRLNKDYAGNKAVRKTYGRVIGNSLHNILLFFP
jgi:hypothetical protein